jgi:membrane protease YdiL (CAAX protease family)
MLKQMILGFGLIVVTQVVFGFILQPIIGIVSPVEMVFFFAFGGIMEEVLYRLFIMNIISGIIRKAGGKRLKNDYYISGSVALAVSSIIFMVAHIGVYGSSPSKLLGALMLGFTFGFVYLISNNIFVPMFIHFVNNAFAEVMDLSRGGAALLQAGQSSTMGDLSYALVSCVVIILAFGIYSIYKWFRMTRQGKPTETTMTLEMAGELNLQQTQQAQTTQQTSFIKRNAKWLVFITLVVFGFIVGGMLGMYDGFQPTAGGFP